MKKFILSFAAFAALAAGANAQVARMSLYEEFTGEDCAPCSAANPIMWSLLNQAGNNGSKIQLLSFEEPIPYTGFLTQQTSAIASTRLSYYPGVTGTPTAVLDGAILPAAPNDYAGDPRSLTQANINAASSITSPFTITMTNAAYDATFTHVTVTINVTAAGAYAPAGGIIKLRAALAESIHYATAPGITGEGTETDFYDVVRGMYPDANGTTIASSWTVGQTMTPIVATFPLNGVVDLNGHPFVVAWIQNDNDKSVAQAAKSNVIAPPARPVDAGIDSVTTLIFGCGTAGAGVNVTNVIHNYGTTPLTSATIYTRVNTGLTGYGTWTTHAWTGNLAAGATTTVTYSVTGIPSTVNASGEFNRVFDSIAVAGDVNYGNNTSYGNALFQLTPAAFTAVRESFESGTIPSGWNDLGSITGNGGITFGVVGSASNHYGHNGSEYALLLTRLFEWNPGYTDYEMMPTYVKPTSGKTTLEFYYAYAQQATNNTDALDVVYSTDCAKTWTSVWHKAGSNLVTHTPPSPVTLNAAQTQYLGVFAPSGNSDYAYAGIDVSSVPTDAIFAFATTTGGGNTIWLDDVQVTNNPLSVANVAPAVATNVSLYPNPAKENTTLDMNLSDATHVTVDVVDAIGRVVAVVANQDMAAGLQKINISTAAMATGIYNIRITTESGVTTQRLSVVK